jgi:hypothetical protein
MYTQARPSGESLRIILPPRALKLANPDLEHFRREQTALRSPIFQFAASREF